MKRFAILGVIIFVIGAGFTYILLRRDAILLPPASERTTETKDATPPASVPQQIEVTYDETGFSPREVIVSVGSTVTFINNSDIPLWVASDPHPEHTDYPPFDAPRILGRLPRQGENISFVFDKVGTWNYHNHTASGDGTDTGVHPGTIVVK
jgi:plastocyanin